MKSNIVLWIFVLALAAGAGGLYLSNSKLQAELAQLRGQNQELKQTAATADEAGKAQVQSVQDELTRLRRDNEELLRLRNEIRQLRDAKQQLTQQAQAAQAQAQTAQAQAQAAQAQVQNAQAQMQALRATGQPPATGLTPEQQAAAQALRAQAAAQAQGMPPDQDKLMACINNLRQIDAAKQQWALENQKSADAAPTAADLAKYLRGGVLPACPAGGVYTINTIGAPPTCSVPGHGLQ